MLQWVFILLLIHLLTNDIAFMAFWGWSLEMYRVTTGIQVVARKKTKKIISPLKLIEILRGALLTIGVVTLSYSTITLKETVTSEV